MHLGYNGTAFSKRKKILLKKKIKRQIPKMKIIFRFQQAQSLQVEPP